MFCVVYQLCRVRGAKAVVRLMPHEAAELEPVIHALQAQVRHNASRTQAELPSMIAGCIFVGGFCALSAALCRPIRFVVDPEYRRLHWRARKEFSCRLEEYGRNQQARMDSCRETKKRCDSQLIDSRIDADDTIKIFKTEADRINCT